MEICSYVKEGRANHIAKRIASAKIRLHDKIENLDFKTLNISDYNKRYLGNKRTNLKKQLELYGRLLYLCLNNNKIEPEYFVLVDYGGGSGIMSFLASEMGIGTVVYNDIYDVSCSDVTNLSNVLGLKIDHIVCGDVGELISYVRSSSISVNAIVSYDVLEHIYNVESHFEKLRNLCDEQLRIVYASGANIANPRTVRRLKKKQLEAEYTNREEEYGHKQRDSLQAYVDVRKSMIANYSTNLSYEQVETLAHATRGLIQQDIENCVDEYCQQGYITYSLEHPTNTCDPYTGNWCEQLIDHEWLEQLLMKQGFSVNIMPGLYNISDDPLLKRFAKILLNSILHYLGQNALSLAKYYVVYANIDKK